MSYVCTLMRGQMSDSDNQSGGKCPYMPYLGRGQMSGGGTCPTLMRTSYKPAGQDA